MFECFILDRNRATRAAREQFVQAEKMWYLAKVGLCAAREHKSCNIEERAVNDESNYSRITPSSKNISAVEYFRRPSRYEKLRAAASFALSFTVNETDSIVTEQIDAGLERFSISGDSLYNDIVPM